MDYYNIPVELRDYRQWVVWKYEQQAASKPSKPCYNPLDDRYAKTDNPYTWGTFDEAVKATVDGSYNGIGFVLTRNDPFCFVDLDPTNDPAEIDLQTRIVSEFNSYSEISPSGAGLHIICKSADLPTGRRHGPIEIYTSGRYMTMTGRVYENKPINYREHSAVNLWTHLGESEAKTKQLEIYNEFSSKTDREIYDIAQFARNGEKFLRLWNGDYTTYHGGDHSSADFALMDILAFYSQDREQLKRMFRLSGLGQRKKANRDDYLEMMISKSFDRIIPKVDLSGLISRVETFLQSKPREELESAVAGITNTRTDYESLYVQPVSAYPQMIFEEQIVRMNSSGQFPIPPGLTGDIAKFIYDQSFKPITEISICGALGLMAGICGRSYNISSNGLNMYILLLAGTGRGKEAMASGVGKIIKSIQPIMPTITDFVGPQDMASGQGLLRYMSDHPTKSFVSIMGEFGIKLKTICDPRASGADLMTQKVMLDMFSKSGVAQTLMPTVYSDSDRNTKPIDSPAFTMIGETAPTWFYQSLDESWIRTGLLPRFTIVEYRGLRPASNYDSERVVPSQELIQKFCTLATTVYKISQTKIPLVVQLDAYSNNRQRLLDVECDKLINDAPNDILAELWSRCHLKTLKLAAILSVGINPYQPVIDKECWDWAESFIRHGIDAICAKFASGSYTSEVNCESGQVKAVTRIIAQYIVGPYEKVKRYAGVGEIMWNAKIVPYAYILNRCHQQRVFKNDKLGVSSAVRRALQTMIDEGELTEIPKVMAKQNFGNGARMFGISGNSVFNAIENNIYLQPDDE